MTVNNKQLLYILCNFGFRMECCVLTDVSANTASKMVNAMIVDTLINTQNSKQHTLEGRS